MIEKPWYFKALRILTRMIKENHLQYKAVARKLYPGKSFRTSDVEIFIGEYKIRISPVEERSFLIEYFYKGQKILIKYKDIEFDLFGDFKLKELNKIILESINELPVQRQENHMKNIIIQEDLGIPGTDIILEKGDRVLYKEMDYNLERTLANDGWNDDGDGFYWHEKGFGLFIDQNKNYVEITTGEDYEKILWKGTIEQFENGYEMGSNLYMDGKKLKAR